MDPESTVRSTVPEYLRLLEVAEGEDRRAAWADDDEGAHPDVFATGYGSWDNPAFLLVGGHISNGWVADLDDRPACSPPWSSSGSQPSTTCSSFTRQCISAISRTPRPGPADTAYLWFDDGPQTWVSECVSREDEIRAVVLNGLESTDASLVAQLFSAWRGSPLPIRSGYWLGDAIVRDVPDSGMSPRDLVALPYADALALARDQLTD